MDGVLLTRKINSEQEEWYKNGEYELIEKYLDYYSNLINEMAEKEEITILDIGGGAGYFLRELEKRVTKSKVKMYLLDTNRYDIWRENEKTKIKYIVGDALEIENYFPDKTFDYVFCNMLFHHILGNNFRTSELYRGKVLNGIRKILKEDGKIGIIDNYNDGFLIDSISCRTVYYLTTNKNRMINKICKFFGSNSAGVGVCMLSKKMWNKMIDEHGLKLIEEVEAPPDKLGILKRVCLFNRRYQEFNLMVLCKK